MKNYLGARCLKVLLAATITGLPMLGIAAQGDVCSTVPKAFSPGYLNDEMIFQCKAAGNLTIPQLYEKGWRVVSLLPQVAANPSNPMDQKASWTVIIEKI